jgi:hypothetical protein
VIYGKKVKELEKCTQMWFEHKLLFYPCGCRYSVGFSQRDGGGPTEYKLCPGHKRYNDRAEEEDIRDNKP